MSDGLRAFLGARPALRRLAWRLGRRLYVSARGEQIACDIESDGETYLQARMFANISPGEKLQVLDIGANQGDWTKHLLSLAAAVRPDRAFIGADLFVLPTHSENFGMAVAEALAHGVPAIVAHGAPWRELDARGCGRWISNDPSTLATTIEELRHEDLAAMGRRGREWMLADFVWANRAREMKAAFDKLMSESKW